MNKPNKSWWFLVSIFPCFSLRKSIPYYYKLWSLILSFLLNTPPHNISIIIKTHSHIYTTSKANIHTKKTKQQWKISSLSIFFCFFSKKFSSGSEGDFFFAHIRTINYVYIITTKYNVYIIHRHEDSSLNYVTIILDIKENEYTFHS